MTRRKLPIGIQTFAKLREDDCYYVDKTGFALRLIDEGTHYFLSRPQRFGKSLFLDTLAELFAGNEPLFRGLQAHGRWDWGRRFPVIRLSFGGGVVQSRAELDRSIRAQLGRNRRNLRVSCADPDDIASCFAELIEQASNTAGERTVVLIDEYDKPILDNLSRPDTAREIRDGLRNLYSVIKDADAHIRFAFLTGVSKFSKAEPVLWAEQSQRHFRRPDVLGHLRLYRGGLGVCLRPGVGRARSATDPRLVQRLQLDR